MRDVAERVDVYIAWFADPLLCWCCCCSLLKHFFFLFFFFSCWLLLLKLGAAAFGVKYVKGPSREMWGEGGPARDDNVIDSGGF